MQQDQPNPTLKGRLLNLEVNINTSRQARTMKQVLADNETSIRQIRNEIEQGTDATILSDKMNFIRELLNQKLEQIDFKIKKHISQQKEKNNQLVELIGIVKNQKLRLQDHLSLLEARLAQIEEKIGMAEQKF